MTLDLLSLQIAASTVIVVSAVMYLLETLLHSAGMAGRFWAAGFLSGVFSAVCYLVWILVPSAYLAIAVGNGAFVSATAFIFLGCAAFNGRRLAVPVTVVIVVVATVIVSALVAGPDGGPWAGAVALFLGNALFAVLGAIETRRGAVGRRWTAAGLTVVLVIEAVWFVARTVAFVSAGPESTVFQTFFGSAVASLLTITLVVAAVVVTSILRTSESTLRGNPETRQLVVDREGVLLRESFRATVRIVLPRAAAAGENLCIVCLRVDDLRRVATAFGPDEAEALARAFRAAVRRHAPTMALVGETDSTGLSVAFATTASTDVGRVVRMLHDRVVADLAALGASVVPVVGIGVARTGEHGFDVESLVARADADAAFAATTGEQPHGLTGR